MSTPRKLSLGTMLAFGVGQAAEGFKNGAFSVFLVFYYQQVVGIPGWMAGLAIGIALAFDAVTDPIAGVASDRTQTRWGRRHPFMLLASFPLLFAFVALFSPPSALGETGTFVWLTVFAILVRGSLTFYYVPHLALGADMAHDYHQRSTVFAFSTVFSITATAMVSFVGYRYFFPTTELFSPGTLNPDGYRPFAMFFAGGMFLAIIACCVGTASEIPYLRGNKPEDFARQRALSIASTFDDFRAVFANSSYRLIFFGMLLSTFAIAVEAVMSPYMGVHFWALPTERLGLISLATLLGLWIGLPLAPWITRRYDKKYALVIPAVVVVVNANFALVLRLMDVSWFPDNDSPWILDLFRPLSGAGHLSAGDPGNIQLNVCRHRG